MNKLIVRIDTVSPQHVRFTIFLNGGNCGELCMRRDESFTFINALKLGADAADLLMEIKNDKGELFSHCGTPEGCIHAADAEVH